MIVRLAKKTAVEWVTQLGSKAAGFLGAYFAGSITDIPDNAELSAYSDIDIMIVISTDETPNKLGKFVYRDVMLEVTYLSWNQISNAEQVLISHHLANSLRKNTIISDATGCLHKLQSEVSKQFPEKKWVQLRCENVCNNIENSLKHINITVPYPDLVLAWLFPTGITTHVLLLAALRNPTVRRRYLAVQEILIEYGHAKFYPKLLNLLGCTHMTPSRIEEHLKALAETFDAAASVAKTPFLFSTDITPFAKPIAIDGSTELIKSGHHHEAIFWIAATFARCHKIFEADAPLKQQIYLPAFKNIMSDLGFNSNEDFIRRADEVIKFLPGLWDVTESILSKNPDIV